MNSTLDQSIFPAGHSRIVVKMAGRSTSRRGTHVENWADEEIGDFIEVWQEDNIQADLTGTPKHSSIQIWRTIVGKIKESLPDFGRDAAACRDKMKMLKADYITTRTNNNESGRARKQCKY